MSAWLSDDDVIRLTGKKRWTAQVRALLGMGSRFDMTPQGKPLAYLEDAKRKVEPKWLA